MAKLECSTDIYDALVWCMAFQQGSEAAMSLPVGDRTLWTLCIIVVLLGIGCLRVSDDCCSWSGGGGAWSVVCAAWSAPRAVVPTNTGEWGSD